MFIQLDKDTTGKRQSLLIGARNQFLRDRLACSCIRHDNSCMILKSKQIKHITTFGALLWESAILTSHALLLRDIAGIGSAPQNGM
jgi:hypothetical protein